MQWLQSKRVPGWLSVAIVFGVFFLVGTGLLSVVGDSLSQLQGNLKEYQTALDLKYQAIEGWLARTPESTSPSAA